MNEQTRASGRSVLLIGLRGSGKSTLARALAERYRVAWIDTDTEALRMLGRSTVAEVWSELGEAAFRGAERDALEAALNVGIPLIALGGGTPTAPGAAERIEHTRRAGRAYVIYLRCDPDVLAARLAGMGDPNRPSLTGLDPVEEIQAVFAQRDPVYVALADRVLQNIGSAEEGIDALRDLFE